MASFFAFRTRTPERDEETDAARLARLTGLVEQITAEIAAEKEGLEKRYRSETTDAGFLLEALNNDDASARSAVRADHLTSSILRCERRLATLSRQAGLMSELRRSLDRFVGSDAMEPDMPEPA